MNKVKVRIAPSPTGYFHIGNARTALFNWLFARKSGGEFILRIEDTDLERSDKKYEKDITDSLKWLGLDWNGPVVHQTERLDIYEKYLKRLLDSGKAFWCGHTKEELEKEKKEQTAKKEAPRHICNHKYEKSEIRNSKFENGIIRLKVDENSTRTIRFEDEIRGIIEWEERLLGDFSLAKDLRVPLYNFAVVIDDVEMQISHVIRGEDHISNTPKQILIYEALGKSIPKFAHLPLILGPNRSKLSSRHGAVSVNEYRKDYLPEALVNFIGFLGYTYLGKGSRPGGGPAGSGDAHKRPGISVGKEILSKEEMAEEFDLKKVHKSGAVFNVEKLNWLNSQYIRRLTPTEFKSLIHSISSGQAGLKVSDEALPLITERLEKLSDVQNFDYFWKEPRYDSNLLDWKDFSRDEIKNSLNETRMLLEHWDRDNFDKDALRLALDDLAKKLGDPSTPLGASRGLVYWPFRVALTGKEKSPDPVEVAAVLGKKAVLERIAAAMNKII